MSLINCPECGKEISDKAEACPHCGLPAQFFTNARGKTLPKGIGVKRVGQWITKIATTDVSEVFSRKTAPPDNPLKGFDPKAFRNALISFDGDYDVLLSPQRYVDSKSLDHFGNNYEKYFKLLSNELILQFVRTNAVSLNIDEASLKRFVSRMQHLQIGRASCRERV